VFSPIEILTEMERFKNTASILLLVIGLLDSFGLGAESAENPMRITIEESIVSICSGDDVLLHYRYGDVPFKPYVERLFSPQGVNILRDAPADHLHHHGLMFAVAVDGVNFWEEHQSPGRQAHRVFSDVKIEKCNDLPQASFTDQIEWLNPPTRELLLKEYRTIKVRHIKDIKASLLTWQSKFELPDGKDSVTITGSPYFGLGMRFLESMDTAGHFYNADGKTGVEDTNGARAAWCAYTAAANGKPVTVAMFDHPNNERHPATWFTMDKRFAYLSLTMNLKEHPFKITSDKTLVVRYAVALWDGRVEADKINQLYQQWIAQPKTPIEIK